MGRKRYTVEQIMRKLREAEVTTRATAIPDNRCRWGLKRFYMYSLWSSSGGLLS
jgi:hypothetical protein